MRRQAFTLVELLVVIAIIAVLTSILLPALFRAREVALRVSCAATLQQWGIGLTNYMVDNRGEMPCSYGPLFGGQYLYQFRVRTNGPDAYLSPVTYPAVISLEMMGPYLKGVPADLSVGATSPRRLTGAWHCPAAFNDLDTVNAVQWDVLGWVYIDYCYYGRSDLWSASNATNPEEITRKRAEPARIWMSDVLFYWGAPPVPQWRYNHRTRGMGNITQIGLASTGLPQFYGMNELFGDGHVVWKQAQLFNAALMSPPTAGTGSHFVHGGGSDALFY